MNIKKLTLIATAVSALSLSPLTHARTESTDMSIIGIEPECSYFADLRFHASPFGSKGNIAVDKDNKAEFDKWCWGGSAGVGTEITPGFEVAVVFNATTNIGTDSASSTSVSSSSSSSTTKTNSDNTTTTSKSEFKLEDKHREAYNNWLTKNPEVLDFLRAQFSSKSNRKELYNLFSAQNYNMRGVKIQTPVNYDGRFGVAPGAAVAADAPQRVSYQMGLVVKRSAEQLQERYRDVLYNNTADNQNYLQTLGNLMSKTREIFGDDSSFNNLKKIIRISGLDDAANAATLDAVHTSITANIDVDGHISNAIIGRLRGNALGDNAAVDWTAILDSTSQIYNSFFNNGATGNSITLSAYGVYLGTLYRDSMPSTGNLRDNGPAAGARTPLNAYHIKIAADVNDDAVRQLFFHEKWANNLIVLGDMIAATEANAHIKLDQMVIGILSSQKGTQQYKDLLKTFEAHLKANDINDKAEDIIEAITKAKAQEAKAKDNKTADTDKASTAVSNNDKPKAIDVNLTKFRVGIEGGVRLLEFGSGSLSVVAGVGATAATGTVAGEDTGWMLGAEVYGGVKGEYAISESMALTARYTYTPALFSAFKLKDTVQAKVKTLGYTDDATMSSLSIHELSAGIRFYF